MPRVGFNREKVATEWRPFDDGEYEVEVHNAEPYQSKAGKPALKLDMIVLSGPDQADGSDVIGRHLFDNMSAVDDGNAFSLAMAIDCFQVPCDEEGFDSDDFIGCTGRVETVQEEFEGVVRTKIDKYLGSG